MSNNKDKELGTYVRLVKLLNLVLKMQNRFVTKDEVCCELQREKRTVERVMGCLKEVFGEALERSESAGESVAWRIKKNRTIPFPPITKDDVLLLNRLSDYLYQSNQEFESERVKTIRECLVKAVDNAARFENELEGLEAAQGSVFRPGVKVQIDPDIVKNIRLAIQDQRLIKVEYFNKKSGKTNINKLEPYGILYSDRTQYLLARHADNFFGNEIHQFLLSNIKSVTLTDQQFKGIDFDMNEYVKDSFGVYREEPYDVKWRFKPKAAAEAKKFIFHPLQKMTENEDGSLTVKFRAGGTLEMAWHIATWGDQVEVIQPADFWQRVEEAEAKRWG